MTNFRTLLAAALLLAHAAAGAHEFTAYADASAQFSQLTAEAAKQRRMPRASEPAAAKLIATLTDHKRFIEAAPFGVADIGQVMSMCDAANRANMAYAMFDLGSYVNKSMKDDPAKVAALTQRTMVRNTVMFQDEVTNLTSFGQRCLGKQVILIADFIKTLKPEQLTAERLAGLTQVRRGIAQAYVGAAMAATDPAFKMENRKKLIDAMAEVSPQYAEVLSLAERKQMRDYALSVRTAVPRELAGQLQKMIDAMSITRCVDLCQLSAPAGGR